MVFGDSSTLSNNPSAQMETPPIIFQSVPVASYFVNWCSYKHYLWTGIRPAARACLELLSQSLEDVSNVYDLSAFMHKGCNHCEIAKITQLLVFMNVLIAPILKL